MLSYCQEQKACRRALIGRHFGESWNPAECHEMCDNCMKKTADQIDGKRTQSIDHVTVFRGTFLEGPDKFSHPESRSRILSLLITELFYLHILNISRGSLHARSLRRIHLYVFRYSLTKNGFTII